MMVTFVSQCEKKALNRTRRVLDAFADRIGDNTWQTVITQEGLLAVKKLLRKTASKNTAVSCHWLRSRSRSELVWVVGNRSKFDLNGRVPVNLTKNYSMKTNLDAGWNTAPVIGLAAAIAGLFHDVGKANKLFQAKLSPKRKTKSFEPYRHEWVSLRIFEAFVAGLDDREWLQKLLVIQPENETAVLKNLRTDSLESKQLARQSRSPFAKMAPFAQMIAWLVVSHHRLPKHISSVSDSGIGLVPDFEYAECWRADRFNWYWNSRNAETSDLEPKAFSENWSFPNGTPIRSKAWCSKAQEIAKRAIRQIEIESVDKEWLDDRFTSHIARLVLMLSDHVYSAGPAKQRWQDKSYRCYANTDRRTGEKKQKLDEHNIGVAQNAYLLAKRLSSLKRNLPSLGRVKPLEKNTNIARFQWQNRAYDLAMGLSERSIDQGFFGINMASTGYGKTIANARIMYALADKRLGCRVSIALGLRTLTQQTGDALSEMLSLGDDDIAVMIGSQAVKALHKFHQDKQENQWELSGSASAERLIPENQVISYEGEIYEGLLKNWLEGSPKLTQLISAPILVSTIDHLMPASEGERGGRQIAPILRLLTSDIILDEPDDFDQADIPALCRLVNFAGVFGSRVLLSSATLPPSIVAGLFDAYRAGREHYNRACGEPRAGNSICCAWFDELSAPAAAEISDLQSFRQHHAELVDSRNQKLAKQPVKRVGALLSVNAESAEHELVVQAMSRAISQNVDQLHTRYGQVHQETGKKVSIGLVRMANINPMVAVAQNFLATSPPDDCSIHYCIYHSRHPLLVRSHMEHVLDQALNRHDEAAIWQVPAIAQALQDSAEKHHIFVVFATAVAEVGRDHDYDWAIAEPSSMRSLIQLAGRVWRHRDRECEKPNLLILDSNYRALRGQSPAFHKPGFESAQFSLNSRNLRDILPAEYFEAISAGPRITEPETLHPEANLVHLEHAHLQECVFGERGLITSNAAQWWQHEISWSSELQRRTRFRDSRADDKLVIYMEDEHDEPVFSIDADSETIPKPIERSLDRPEPALAEGVTPWIDLTVKPLLEELVESRGISWSKASRVFTELRIEQGWEGRGMCYVPDFGVYRAL